MSGEMTKLGSRYIAASACSRKSLFLSFLSLALVVLSCLLSRDGGKHGYCSLRSVLRNDSFQDAFTFPKINGYLLGEKWVLIIS